MAVPHDSASKFQEYARPEMLVSTDWLAEYLDDPGLVVAESDEVGESPCRLGEVEPCRRSGSARGLCCVPGEIHGCPLPPRP